MRLAGNMSTLVDLIDTSTVLCSSTRDRRQSGRRLLLEIKLEPNEVVIFHRYGVAPFLENNQAFALKHRL